MQRRNIVSSGLIGILAASAAPAVVATPKIRWRLATSFPKSVDIIYEVGQEFSRSVLESTGGQLHITLHPAPELVPAMSVVDAAQNGSVEMIQTCPFYFTGKGASWAFGSTVPFGLTARQMDSWLAVSEGRKLLDQFFLDQNLVYFPSSGPGAQFGGWYRKEVNTIADVKGLKIRVGGGLFGEVAKRMGMVPQNMPVGETYQAMEKGTIDAVEWVGPYDDEKLGFNKVAPYYYHPGWWEGSGANAWFVNKQAWQSLPNNCKEAIRVATVASGLHFISRYDQENPKALIRLIATGVKLRAFSKEILDSGLVATKEVLSEIEDRDPLFKKIHHDLRNFQREQQLHERYTDLHFNNIVNRVKF